MPFQCLHSTETLIIKIIFSGYERLTSKCSKASCCDGLKVNSDETAQDLILHGLYKLGGQNVKV
jgi:hypothetical protein